MLKNHCKARSLLVINDAEWVGGHEVMGMKAIEGLLAQGWRIHVLCSKRNSRFIEMLNLVEHPSLTLDALPMKASRLKSVVPFFFVSELRLLFRYIRRHADFGTVLLLQGRIEAGAIAAIATKLQGRQIVSYVPFAHSAKVVSGRRLSGQIRDIINRIYYRMIGSFITCYEGAKYDIQRWAPKAQVRVVRNPMPEKKALPHTTEFRSRHSIPANSFLVGIVGRIEFRQKGQEFILNNFDKVFNGIDSPHLCIVGEGPDSDRLKEMIDQYGLGDRIKVVEWVDSVDEVLGSLDCLLIPSRFEGVPLVMLEALAVGTPVIATRVDGMVEYISNDRLFSPDDALSCNQCLRTISRGPKQSEASRGATVRSDLKSSFEPDFNNALEDLLDLSVG